MFMFQCSIIMWSANYIYVPINYNYVVSTHHRYCNYIYCLNYLLLFASQHRTVYCSELFVCAVWLILIAVQHRLHIGNVVNCLCVLCG